MSASSALAAALIRSGSPIRIGSIRPRLAESSAPPSELWSSGQTTAVFSGGSLAAIATSVPKWSTDVDDQRRKVARLGDLGDGRRLDLGGSLADELAAGVDDLGVEHGDRRLALLAADDRDRDLVADMDAAQEAQVLRPIERAGAGKDVAEHGGDQRADPHRRRDWIGRVLGAFGRRQHQRVQVARDMGEQDQVLHRAGPLDAGGVADLEFGPGRVANGGFCAHVRPLRSLAAHASPPPPVFVKWAGQFHPARGLSFVRCTITAGA